jgi:hypothetical protein
MPGSGPHERPARLIEKPLFGAAFFHPAPAGGCDI